MTTSIGLSPDARPNVDLFLQPQAWVDLNPTLNVCNPERNNPRQAVPIDEAMGRSLEALLVKEGYFQLDRVAWELPLADMAQAIVRLVERGLVPPFCFMYDEFWVMFFRLQQLMNRLLGEGYAMLPDFWAWHVDPRAGQSGWKAHRDKGTKSLFPDGRPKSLTVWLPLTDATTLNGCMYIVPAYMDPTYNRPNDRDWKFQPQDIRALPIAAGGMLCWTQAVVHWGSHSTPRADKPRISLAFEFQRGDIPPMNTPLLPPWVALTIEQRLSLICKQVVQYQHMYPLSLELKAFIEAVRAYRPQNSRL